jgi:hypothetical protein
MKKIYTLLAMSFLLASCEGGSSCENCGTMSAGDEGGTIRLNLGTIEAPFDATDIKSFRIRVYANTPVSPDDPTLFDSYSAYGCFPSRGKDVTIENLKTGENRFVYYQGYSDKACQDPEMVALRGGVTIEKRSALDKTAAEIDCTEDSQCTSLHPYAVCACEKELDNDGKKTDLCLAGEPGTCSVTPPLYVMPLQVGRFNAFPSVDDALLTKIAAISCESDAPCQDIHGNGVCDYDRGRCTIKGLNPLAPAVRRAFHTATTLESGNIALGGGFNRRSIVGSKPMFRADAPFVEIFNPYTFQFLPVPAGALADGNRVAMHTAVPLGGERLAFLGGVTEASLDVNVGGQQELRVVMPINLEQDYCNGEDCSNVSAWSLVFDLASTGAFGRNPLSAGFLFPKAGLYSGNLLLSGGLIFAEDGSSQVYDRFQLCSLSDGTSMACSEGGDESSLYAPRFGHSHVCLVAASDGSCGEYMLFGGTDAGNSGGEVFSVNGGTHKALEFVQDSDMDGAFFSTLVKVAAGDDGLAQIFAFGGTNAVGDPVPAGATSVRVDIFPPALGPAPQQIKVNLGEGKLTVAELDLSELSGANPERKTFRTFNTAVPMEGGDILVAGGLDRDNRASSQAIFFRDPQVGTMQVIGELSMTSPRFGHTMTVIEHGLLKGAVLVVGGFTVGADGVVDFATHAEVYLPAN